MSNFELKFIVVVYDARWYLAVTKSREMASVQHRLITLRNGIGNAISIPIQRTVSS